MASATDYFKKVGLPGNATTLASPGHAIAGTTFTVDSTSLWPTDTGVTFGIDQVTLVDGKEVRVPNSYTVWDGVVSSATTLSGCVLRYGTDQAYPAGSTTRVYILPTSVRENKMVDGILAQHHQDGSHGDITATSLSTTRIKGGSNNTLGHLVPNVTDDTVALLNAAQTMSNHTFDTTNSFGIGAILGAALKYSDLIHTGGHSSSTQTSTSYTDLNGPGVTWTPATAQRVLILAFVHGYVSTAGTGWNLKLACDGAAVSGYSLVDGIVSIQANQRDSLILIGDAVVTGGTLHTVKVQGGSQGAGTAVLYANMVVFSLGNA